MEPWRIVIVDDEALMAGALKLFLELADDLDVVGMASNGLEAISLCRELRPHVVLMDLSMPVLEGVSATRRISAEMPTTSNSDAAVKISGVLLRAIQRSRGRNASRPPTMIPVITATILIAS